MCTYMLQCFFPLFLLSTTKQKQNRFLVSSTMLSPCFSSHFDCNCSSLLTTRSAFCINAVWSGACYGLKCTFPISRLTSSFISCQHRAIKTILANHMLLLNPLSLSLDHFVNVCVVCTKYIYNTRGKTNVELSKEFVISWDRFS